MLDIKFLLLLVCLYFWLTSSREDENLLVKAIFRKFHIYVNSIIFMIFSKDSKGIGPKYNPNPDRGKKRDEYKTIVFIRHGESDWNDVFNKGMNIGFIFRLTRAMWREFVLYPSSDSVFLDSPLNSDGIDQALELRRYLSTPNVSSSDVISPLLGEISGELIGDEKKIKSVIVSSQLRRAVATTVLSLWNRIEKTGEKIILLSCLQEISRNVDTYSLSDPNSIADLPFSRIIPHCGNKNDGFDSSKIFASQENFGNKSRKFYGIKRLTAFNEWAFKRPEEVIIVGGHSLWFKAYFQTYLPHDDNHEAKTKKIVNSGVIALRIHSEYFEKENTTGYRIDPSSIQTLYGGFMK